MASPVTVRRLEGRQLLCTAGGHEVITDRKVEDGGADGGCTSGELLLLAIGSCAAGSVRRHLEEAGPAPADLQVEVSLEPSPTGGERDMILISVLLPAGLLKNGEAAIKRAAVSGGVVSRLALGSEIEVQCRANDQPSE